jgi:4-hydroxybenzoate polyprenyltransferase
MKTSWGVEMKDINKAGGIDIYPYILMTRPSHWVKNIFVIPGIFIALLAYPQTFLSIIPKVLIGFIGICALASANYVINEWLDRKYDRYHPSKNKRPAVLGQVSFLGVMVGYHILVVFGLILGFQLSFSFGLLSLVFLIMAIIYNVEPIRTKDMPYLDVLTESINNPIRLCFGWLMVTTSVLPPSSLILGYWFSGAFLMAAKRLAEFRAINNRNQAEYYRASFKWYTVDKLIASCLFYGMLTSFFLGVFLIKYKIELILFFPLLVGLFSLYIILSMKPESVAQKPEKLIKEKQLMIYIAIMVLIFLLLLIIEIPWLDIFVSKAFIIN